MNEVATKTSGRWLIQGLVTTAIFAIFTSAGGYFVKKQVPKDVVLYYAIDSRTIGETTTWHIVLRNNSTNAFNPVTVKPPQNKKVIHIAYAPAATNTAESSSPQWDGTVRSGDSLEVLVVIEEATSAPPSSVVDQMVSAEFQSIDDAGKPTSHEVPLKEAGFLTFSRGVLTIFWFSVPWVCGVVVFFLGRWILRKLGLLEWFAGLFNFA